MNQDPLTGVPAPSSARADPTLVLPGAATTLPARGVIGRLALSVTLFTCTIGFVVDFFNAGLAVLGQVFLAKFRFGADPRQLGVLGAATALGYVLPALFSGWISEKIGRRPVILFALSGLTATCFLAPHARTLAELDALGFARSASTAFLWAPLMAWMTEITPREALSRLLGRYNISWALGILLGFAFAGYCSQHFGPERLFEVAGGMSLATLALVLLTSPRWTAAITAVDGFDPSHETQLVAEIPIAAQPHRWVLRGLALVATACAVQGLLLYLTPDLVGQRTSETMQGALLAARTGGQVAGFFWFSHHGDAWHFRRWPLAVALGSFIAGLALLAATPSWIALWLLGYTIIGFGVGASYIQCMYYSLSLSKNKGLAGGAMETSVGAGDFLGPLVGGDFAARTTPRTALATAILPLAVIMAWAMRLKSGRQLSDAGRHRIGGPERNSAGVGSDLK